MEEVKGDVSFGSHDLLHCCVVLDKNLLNLGLAVILVQTQVETVDFKHD